MAALSAVDALTTPGVVNATISQEQQLLAAGENEALGAGESLVELSQVNEVEKVLAPLLVALIALSNLLLLGHEARLVWQTQRLIQPKLLVLALSTSDLLATLLGFLPLWILFLIDQNARNDGMLSNVHHAVLGNQSASIDRTDSLWQANSTVSVVTITDLHKPDISSGQQIVHISTYSVLLFFLTSFWTLAQFIVLLMGIERFLALRLPFFYAARCSCKQFLVVLGLLTMVSGGFGAFHLVVQREEFGKNPLVFAGFMDIRSLAYHVFTLVQGLVRTVMLFLCQWAVRRELRQMERRVTVVRVKDQSEYMNQLSMLQGAGREYVRFVLAVNLVLLLSESPSLVCAMLRMSRLSFRFTIQYFCWRISHTSALLNPLLYGFLRKSLCSRIRCFLNQHWPCPGSQKVGASDTGQAARQSNRTRNSTVMPLDPEASFA